MPKPSSSESNPNAFFWVNQAHYFARHAIVQSFKKNGTDLTAEQWGILEYLWYKKEAAQTEIAKATGRDKPSITRLVVSLEKKGFLKRSRADMRTNRVVLTERGQQLNREYGPLLQKIVDEAMSSMPKKDRSILRDLLKAFAINLSQLSAAKTRRQTTVVKLKAKA